MCCLPCLNFSKAFCSERFKMEGGVRERTGEKNKVEDWMIIKHDDL
jgi:hypothetical protein